MAIDIGQAEPVAGHFRFEGGPHDSDSGVVVWIELDIEYRLPGIAPNVKVVVPVQWDDGKTMAQIKAEAYAAMATLLKHAASCDLGALPSEAAVPNLDEIFAKSGSQPV